MKRTSIVVLAISLSGISSLSAAASSVFPSAAQEFPPIQAKETYMQRHRADVAMQRTVAGPSGAVMWDPIQSRDTFMLRHLNDIPQQRDVAFPSSARD